MARGDLHKKLIREAAERNGFTVTEGQSWSLVRDGRIVWSVYWLKSGYMSGAFSSVLGVSVQPDYRTHAATSSPRQILDSFIDALDTDRWRERGAR